MICHRPRARVRVTGLVHVDVRRKWRPMRRPCILYCPRTEGNIPTEVGLWDGYDNLSTWLRCHWRDRVVSDSRFSISALSTGRCPPRMVMRLIQDGW